MNCPVCKDEPMIVLELHEVEIDHCLECKGIWLDAGELELLLEDHDKKDQLLSSFRTVENSLERKRKCPICLKYMEKVLVNERVTIDRCVDKHGLWFDLGELEQIIASENSGENTVLSLLQEMFGK